MIDGDSLWVVTSSSEELELRLVDVDCPEGKQPYGDAARQTLAKLVNGHELSVRKTGIDDYGRTLSRIYIGDRYVNAELVRAGAAWVYRHYSKDEQLIALETEAREAKRGLWALPESERVPPWDWRHGKKDREAPAFKCGLKHYCREMKSCAEARFFLEKCGVKSLDGDGDGRPCASLCRR